MATRIQLRRDTEANWSSNNPTLSEGEIGLVTDGSNKGFGKVGDGSTVWNALGYQIGGGGSTEFRITQASHILDAGAPIKFASSTYSVAQANSSANAEVLGIITDDDPNNDGNEFTFITAGAVTLTTPEWDAVTGETGGLTAEVIYFLDAASAGMYTQTAPTGETEINKPMFYAVSTTEAYWLNYRGVEVAASTSSFYQDITGGTSTAVTHNFGHKYVAVQVVDKTTDEIIIPDDVTMTSATQVTVDLSSFAATSFRVLIFDQGAEFNSVGKADSTDVNTGTDDTKYITSSALAGSNRGKSGRSTYTHYHTVNDNGSTNVNVQKFLSPVTASDDVVVTIENSTTLGFSILANMDCYLHVSYTATFSADIQFAISLNSTAAALSLGTSNRLAMNNSNAANKAAIINWSGSIDSGDVVRPVTATGATKGASPQIGTITVLAIEKL